jgi:hypothetical protein
MITLLSCLAYSLALRMGAKRSSEAAFTVLYPRQENYITTAMGISNPTYMSDDDKQRGI